MDGLPLDHILLTREDLARRDRAAMSRDAAAGRIVRVAVGAYLDADTWSSLDSDGRFRCRIAAEVARRPDDQPVTHLSAAAMWRLPIIGPWPDRVETTIPNDSSARSRTGLIRHRGSPVRHGQRIDGIRASGLARTIVDVAATRPLDVSLAMADAALAGRTATGRSVDLADLERARDEAGHVRGASRIDRMLELADGRAESPGESLSRCRIRSLGFPAPVLQQEFHDAQGLIGAVDFWWPEVGLVGEFDGVAKYVRHELTGGRSVAEVVLAEKRRESRLRALVDDIVRWEWADARSPRALDGILRSGGLRPTRARAR
ncbi:hypothetical protein [Homoserinibacter sp. YIM 151385]|uniref:hypothetical protein n=1 Tax=Homoserinibacter sp. YIM 151385 TaxID=2985506 RepID=UPI0022F03464|nr:hypothetical protein [Homoserinibacter sp. YIM 151385]WBU36807.1 hypothetical protein OF852_07610 [Homoserinibacter sp. YIM 151385]